MTTKTPTELAIEALMRSKVDYCAMIDIALDALQPEAALANSGESIEALLGRVPKSANFGLYTLPGNRFGFSIYPTDRDLKQSEGPTPAAAIKAALKQLEE